MITKQREILLILSLFILAFGIRIYKITQSPQGLYIDETSIGYNAYSLLTTGKDEHGRSWPLFFEAFGEWKLPVYIYAVWFTQLFFGPTDLSVRLPAVIFGSLSAGLIYLWLKELLKLARFEKFEYVPIVAGILLAISPWYYMFSRPGHEAAIALFFEILALYLFFKAVNNRSWTNLIFSGLSFITTLYTYNSSRIVTPLLALMLIILYRKVFSFKQWLLTLFLCLIILQPFWQFISSPAGLVRSQQASIFYQDVSLLETFIKNYWQSASPWTLFVAGDFYDKAPHYIGLLHIFELPFFITGLIYLLWLIRKSTDFIKPGSVILALLVIGFIPGAISFPSPLALRTLLVLPSTLFISALGIGHVGYTLRSYWRTAFYIILSFIAIFSWRQFYNEYHQGYIITASERVWQYGKRQTLLEVKKLAPIYGKIYLHPDLRIVNAAWYLKFDPAMYFEKLYLDQDMRQYEFIDSPNNIPDSNRPILYAGPADMLDAEPLRQIFEYQNNAIFYIWDLR